MDVVGDELGAFAGEYTVEHEFENIKGGGFSSGISGVDDSVDHDGDACAIGIFFIGEELAYYFCDGDALVTFVWNIFKVDDAKSVGTFDTLASYGWSFTNTLA